jgi:LacI family transcriptional regulator
VSSTSRVRLVDVAAAANVSKQTVSRVVTGSADVAEHTREHVLEVIARLGYRPSASARTLCHGRSYTLAVVGFDFGFLSTDLYQGAAQQAQALGYNLLLKTLAKPDTVSVEQLLLGLTDMHVDGVLWVIPDAYNRCDWISSNLLARINIPVVFLSTEPRPGIVTVSFDNYDGARLATQHLIAQGRKRIAHISGPLAWWVARERVRGWRSALQDAGLQAQDTHLAEGNWSPVSGEQAMVQLLGRGADFDAVFVANDRMALGAMLTAHRYALKIPQDLAVIGFDNIIESACFFPPLTTIVQDKHSHGKLAIATLIRHVMAHFGEPAEKHPRLFPLTHTLVVRESTTVAP